MLFEEKITVNKDAFLSKVNAIAQKLQINPDWLMAVMNSETGGTFSPSIQNPLTKATGLIQFMPDTAFYQLGTSIDTLKQMSNVDQLEYVYKYFAPYKNYITKYEDLYLITFYPNADKKFAGTLSKPDTWAFPDSVYVANRGIDMNKDGTLTIGDFRQWIMAKIPPAWFTQINQSMAVVEKFAKRNFFFIILGGGLIAAGTYFLLTGTLTKNKMK